MKEKRILFVYVNTKGYSLWEKKEYLLSRPQFDEYYDKEFFESLIEKTKRNSEELLYAVGNVGGDFIAQNITTPSRVISEPINIDLLKREIENFQPTHIGFSIVLGAYELFKECAQFVRNNYPHIRIVAGDVGALIPETKNYADYICRGEGVKFLRSVLEEDPNLKIKIPCSEVIRFRPNPLNPAQWLPAKFGILTTDLGCGMGCDFCITYALYKRNYIIGNAHKIKRALLEIAEMLTKEKDASDIDIILTDPYGLKDEKLWSKVIALMRGENYCFHFHVITSGILLARYSKPGRLLDKFQKSQEMELSFAEIGLETVRPIYKKNIGVNWKKLMKTLKNFGITAALTLIIGYDYHDRKTIFADIEEALSYDASLLHPVNLRILPETKLWHKFLRNNRLLEVPPEFRVLWGYQAYLHPYINPRFKDLLPIMLELDEIVYSGQGSIYTRLLDVIKNRKMTPSNRRLIQIGEMMVKLRKRESK